MVSYVKNIFVLFLSLLNRNRDIFFRFLLLVFDAVKGTGTVPPQFDDSSFGSNRPHQFWFNDRYGDGDLNLFMPGWRVGCFDQPWRPRFFRVVETEVRIKNLKTLLNNSFAVLHWRLQLRTFCGDLISTELFTSDTAHRTIFKIKHCLAHTKFCLSILFSTMSQLFLRFLHTIRWMVL